MALIIDFKYVPYSGEVILNDVSLDILNINFKQVWRKYAGSASPVIIDSSRTIVAGTDFPADVNVNVCLIGGGGAGSAYSYGGSFGGQAGAIVSTVINYPAGTSLPVVIGSGGASVFNPQGPSNGSASSFSGNTAAGGAGGRPAIYGETIIPASFLGDGESRITCAGKTYNGHNVFVGNELIQWYLWGGEAGLGNGGTPSATQGSPVNDAPPGGGGGGGGTIVNDTALWSGKGGNGRLILSWTSAS